MMGGRGMQVEDLIGRILTDAEKLAINREKVKDIGCFSHTGRSTALGSNCIGGSATTSVCAIVTITESGNYYVSFGGYTANVVDNNHKPIF